MLAGRLLTLAGFAYWYALVFLAFPRMAPRATEFPDFAVATLQNAEQFKSASIGNAGITPNEVLAWRAVAFSTDAESTFVWLLATAKPAGQLYALAGLRLRKPVLFAREAARFRNRTDQVFVQSGCIRSSVSFGDVVAQLERGAWVPGFVRGAWLE